MDKEELAWNKFQQSRAKRRMKHDKNLPADCEGCAVGMRWKVEEDVLLISMLASHMQMKDFCNALNRSAGGIKGRLATLGLGGGFPFKHTWLIRRKKVQSFDPKVREALIKAGWVEKPFTGCLDAPHWWRGAQFHFDGFDFRTSTTRFEIWGKGDNSVRVSDMSIDRLKRALAAAERYAESNVENTRKMEFWSEWAEVLLTELESRKKG